MSFPSSTFAKSPATHSNAPAEPEYVLQPPLPAPASAADVPKATASTWPQLFKTMVLPTFVAMAIKLLRIWVDPGLAKDILTRLDQQPVHLSGKERMEQLLESIRDSYIDPRTLQLVEVIAHAYHIIWAGGSNFSVQALEEPLSKLEPHLLGLPSRHSGDSVHKVMQVAVPGVLRLLRQFFNGAGVPDMEGVANYLQSINSIDNQQVLRVVLPDNLQWLPNFFWGWGQLLEALQDPALFVATTLQSQTDALAAQSSQAIEQGTAFLETALQSPLAGLVRDFLDERFGVRLPEETLATQAVPLFMDATMRNSPGSLQAITYLSDLASAAQALRALSSFPYQLSVSAQLGWGFDFLQAPQTRQAMQLLMPERIATPILATGDIGARLARLPDDASVNVLLDEVTNAIAQSPHRHLLEAHLPMPLAQLAEQFERWSPLTSRITRLNDETADSQAWSRVSIIGMGLWEMVTQEAKAYLDRTVQDGELVSEVVIPLAVWGFMLGGYKVPQTMGELAELVVKKVIKGLFPQVYGALNAALWLRKVNSYLWTFREFWQVYQQPPSAAREQKLFTYLADAIGLWSWVTPLIIQVRELFYLLPPLLAMYQAQGDEVAEEGALERIGLIVTKLHDSSNPVVQAWLRRLKILAISLVTGLSEEQISPYIPTTAGTDSDLDQQYRSGTPSEQSYLGPATVTQSSARTIAEHLQGARNLYDYLVPATTASKLSKMLAGFMLNIPMASAADDDGSTVIDHGELQEMAGIPTAVESLAAHNARANAEIYGGVGALAAALLFAAMAYRWRNHGEASAPTAAGAGSSAKQPEATAAESGALLAPYDKSWEHDNSVFKATTQPVALSERVANGIRSVGQSISNQRKWIAAGAAATAAVVGVGLVWHGMASKLGEKEIAALLHKPGKNGKPVIDNVAVALEAEYDMQQLWEDDDAMELAMIELATAAGYVPTEAEQAEWPTVSLQKKSSREARDTDAILDALSAGAELVQLSVEAAIRLSDIVEVLKQELMIQEAIKIVLKDEMQEHMDKKPTMPAHLFTPEGYAEHIGNQLYSKYADQLPADRKSYNAERTHVLNVSGQNKDLRSPLLGVLTLGTSHFQSLAARERNPYTYQPMIADGRMYIDEEVEISEYDMLTGKLAEQTNALLYVKKDASRYDLGGPEPKELYKEMLTTDLEASYLKALAPEFERLRPALQNGRMKLIQDMLRLRVKIPGYNPIQALKSGQASLHEVDLLEDKARATASDTVRNVVGFVDRTWDLQFLLFLQSGTLTDVSQAGGRARRLFGERYSEGVGEGRNPHRIHQFQIRDYATLLGIMDGKKPRSTVFPTDYVAKRIPAEVLQEALKAKRSDGSPRFDAGLIGQYQRLQAGLGPYDALESVKYHAYDGVAISLGPRRTLSEIAERQIADLELDLKNQMDKATRNEQEQADIYNGDVAGWIFGIVAMAFAAVSLIPTAGSGTLAAMSAISAIASAASSNSQRILHADTVEDATYYRNTIMLNIMLELFALGAGLKVGDVFRLPKALGTAFAAIKKRTKARLMKLQEHAARIPAGPAKTKAEKVAEAAAKAKKLEDDKIKRILNSKTRLNNSPKPFNIETWIKDNPALYNSISENAMSDILGPMIVLGALISGPIGVDYMAKLNKPEFEAEAKRLAEEAVDDASGLPSTPNAQPSIYHTLVVQPFQRYVVDLDYLDYRDSPMDFHYRQVPLGTLDLELEDLAARPADSASTVTPLRYQRSDTDRWYIYDRHQVLGTGVYRMIGHTLYKLATRAEQLLGYGAAFNGLYKMQMNGAYVHEVLIKARGHEVPDALQKHGFALMDPLKRKAYFDQVIVDKIPSDRPALTAFNNARDKSASAAALLAELARYEELVMVGPGSYPSLIATTDYRQSISLAKQQIETALEQMSKELDAAPLHPDGRYSDREVYFELKERLLLNVDSLNRSLNELNIYDDNSVAFLQLYVASRRIQVVAEELRVIEQGPANDIMARNQRIADMAKARREYDQVYNALTPEQQSIGRKLFPREH